MNLNDNFEHIKARLDLMDIVQEDVTLKKSGKTYQSNCPFHDDRTPSFTVWPREQKFKCFGCDASGDVIDYIQQRENIQNVVGALQFISHKYGIQLTGYDEEYYDRKKSDLQKNRKAYVKFYKQKNAAYEYLKGRGISEQVTERFKIGHNDNNHSITIPIFSPYGDLLGMAERFLASDAKPKYKNSPESEFYKKSEILYGLNEARKDINKEVYIVEGYFDVLSMYEFGLEKTVGYAGQAITEQQSKLLSKYITKYTKIYLIPDKDHTGQNFIKKNVKALRLHNRNEIRIIDLPDDCKDINDYLQAGRNFGELQNVSNEMFLLRQDLDNCSAIEDEYEVSQQYAKVTSNKMIRADMATYLADRWKKPIELVRDHMNSEKQVTDYSRKLYTATEAYMGYRDHLNEGDEGKLFTGFADIDRVIKHVAPGQVLTIIGRSGAGKTTFAVNLMYNVIFKQKFNVVFNSLEMPKEHIIPQFIQLKKQIPLHRVESIVSSDKWDEDVGEVLEMLDKHWRIADDDSQSIEDLEQFVLAANDSAFDEPVKVIFVDYLQYMRPEENGNKPRHEKIGDIARGFKALAKRHKIVVVALSQASREDGKDGSEKLTKSSASDSKAVEDSSDYMLGIRRSAANTQLDKDEKLSLQNEMYCQVLKNRFGWETDIPLFYDGMTKRIEDSNGRVPEKSELEKILKKKKGRK
jgi:replicative DNA helicase